MKKVIFWLVVLGIIVGGIWYGTKDTVVPTDEPPVTVTENTTYRNSNLGISFTYPKMLAASTTGNVVTLHHQVPFTHHDFCDFKGEGTTTIPTLTDFHVNFQIANQGLVDAMKSFSPYIPQENFVNGQVVESPGFIDAYNAGDLEGFKIFEGAEGCGHTIYYLSVSNNKTLIVKEDWATIFSGAIEQELEAAAKAVPGVINKERSAEIFDAILKTVEIN